MQRRTVLELLDVHRDATALLPGILDAGCDQFVLEFAGRQMTEADLWREFAIDRELGAGSGRGRGGREVLLP